jgi:hypothetical protein
LANTGKKRQPKCYGDRVTDRARIARDVQRIVALRGVAGAVDAPVARRRLRSVQRDLRLEVGPGVPKTQAASILGVSVTALDKWIARGKLPVVRRPGSSRTEIDADALIDLASDVTRRREEGQRRGVLASAFAQLDEHGGLAVPRPNQSPRDLREHYVRTTPAERLRETAELSAVLTRLAARERPAR